jgi:signal transduction histidine kinase
MKKPLITINTAILTSIVIVLSCVVIGLHALNFLDSKNALYEDLYTRKSSITNRLAAELVEPLWDLQREQVETLVEHEMADKHLHSILVSDMSGNRFLARTRDTEWNTVPADSEILFDPDGELNEKRTLHKLGLKVGTIEVSLTDRFVRQRLGDLLTRTVVSIVLVNLLAIGILYLVIRKVIISPVRALHDYATTVGKGNLDCPRPDGLFLREIAELGDAMHTMTCNLNRTIVDITSAEKDLAELNRHLERLVEERTKDLAEKADELETANVRLMALDELKTAFLTTVSHDIRTPLTSIIGFTKLITRDYANCINAAARGDEIPGRRVERISDNLDIILQEGERLSRLVSDFLDLSKIEAGQVKWNDALINPERIIRQAVASIRGQLDEKSNLNLTYDLQDGLPPIYADPDRIAQVLVNLLGNAAKFTAQGEIQIIAKRNNGDLRIEVADTGNGIPDTDLDRIFDKFHKVGQGDTVSAGPEGTGLGLAICRQIVEHYGGRIWAESRLGHGSTFIFELPVTTA